VIMRGEGVGASMNSHPRMKGAEAPAGGGLPELLLGKATDPLTVARRGYGRIYDRAVSRIGKRGVNRWGKKKATQSGWPKLAGLPRPPPQRRGSLSQQHHRSWYIDPSQNTILKTAKPSANPKGIILVAAGAAMATFLGVVFLDPRPGE
jgi:hypothetical protein